MKLFNSRVFFLFCIFLSLIYWTYLFFTSQMLISADAVVFERLGTLLYKSGWVEFLQTGPSREPLYPLTIALSMRLADLWEVPFQKIQLIFQLAVLILTQFLMLMILRKIKIRPVIAACAIFYFGISPAVINSAFSLFSEIICFPLILTIVLLGAYGWRSIQEYSWQKAAMWGCLLGLTFVLAIMAKAIFEFVAYAFFVPFLILFIRSCVKRQFKCLMSSFCFLLVTVFIVEGGILTYKFLNKKFNGHFAVTDRGAWLVYGNADRRTQPADLTRVMTAFVYAHGEGLCKSIFPKENCGFWSFTTSDNLGWRKSNELRASQISEGELDKELIRSAKEKILQNPLQYLLFFTIDIIRMLFWESTQVGFVAYPVWLSKIYDFALFKNTLRLLIYIVTVFSIFYLSIFVWRNKVQLKNYGLGNVNRIQMIFISIIFLLSYVSLHSLVSIVIRYAIPLAPLYLILIAASFHKLIFKD